MIATHLSYFLIYFLQNTLALKKTALTMPSTSLLSTEYSVFPIQPSKTAVIADFAHKSVIDSSNDDISQLHDQNDINRTFTLKFMMIFAIIH